jgi:hypothetical protein
MIEALLLLLVKLIIIGAIFWLLFYAVGKVPMAEPVKTIVNVVLIVVLVIILIYFLLAMLPATARFP